MDRAASTIATGILIYMLCFSILGLGNTASLSIAVASVISMMMASTVLGRLGGAHGGRQGDARWSAPLETPLQLSDPQQLDNSPILSRLCARVVRTMFSHGRP